MPYDLKLSHFSLSLQKDVASGQVVDREGVVLRSVMEAGNEKVLRYLTVRTDAGRLRRRARDEEPEAETEADQEQREESD